jgi:hypothetical protein
VLIVIDNAPDAEQVRPLLPGGPGSLVLVTSRNQLPALAAEAARPLHVEPFSPDEARELLASRLGAERTDAGAAGRHSEALPPGAGGAADTPDRRALVGAGHRGELGGLAVQMREMHNNGWPMA